MADAKDSPAIPAAADSTPSAAAATTAVVNYNERVMKDIPAPASAPLAHADLFNATPASSSNAAAPTLSLNIKNLKEHLAKEGRLEIKDALVLIKTAASIFKQEPNLLAIKDPVTVCGDVHGQYYDLLKLLEIGGEPSDSKYLFLGDYVDRGMFGSEVCFLLFAYKIMNPSTFYMIRGNHECRHLTAYFNFKQECLYKYNLEIYDAFMDAFDCLPLGAILNDRFLCVHGGISPEIKTVEDIYHIDRFREIPSNGPMCDLMWSDPMEEEEEANNPNHDYLHNETRGCSYVFSYGAVNTFLKNNRLLSVIRAHEAQDEGYRLYKAGATTKFPTVICIFSAPNYCDVYGNKAAVIRFQNNLMNIRQFNASPHPYYLPNFMNAFNWSMPFVVEKVMDMFNVILNLCDPSEDEVDVDEEDASGESPKIDQDRAVAIKMKIRSVGRMCRIFSTLREEHESIVLLKGLAGGQLPQGILSQGPAAIRKVVMDFKTAKEFDRANEKRPLSAAELQAANEKPKVIPASKADSESTPADVVEAAKIAIKVEKE